VQPFLLLLGCRSAPSCGFVIVATASPLSLSLLHHCRCRCCIIAAAASSAASLLSLSLLHHCCCHCCCITAAVAVPSQLLSHICHHCCCRIAAITAVIFFFGMATPLSNADLPQLPDDNRLNGRNYLQFIRRTLKGTGRLNHIEGEAISPDNPSFQIWDNDDSRIITWLWGSMTTEISKNYMFYSSAREI